VKPGAHTITRRDLLGMGMAGVGASLLSGCQVFKGTGPATDIPLIDPVIVARVSPPRASAMLGTTSPYNEGQTEAIMYVPTTYRASTPAPFVLMLHAEGAASATALDLFLPYADALGLVILAVDSSGATWDTYALDYYGPDVAFINNALVAAFNEVNIDPTRVSVGGFSDGGGYALALGLTNGALFSRVVAFTPSSLAPYASSGSPKFFISQGLNDSLVDPADGGRFISHTLISRGYAVDYVEFAGVHEVPDAIIQQGLAWMTS
jgi:predicted esterase